jgi:hypothetical protein
LKQQQILAIFQPNSAALSRHDFGECNSHTHSDSTAPKACNSSTMAT